MEIELSDYCNGLEQQLLAATRQVIILNIQIQKLEEALGAKNGRNESSNGRSNEEVARIAGRSEQSGAVSKG